MMAARSLLVHRHRAGDRERCAPDGAGVSTPALSRKSAFFERSDDRGEGLTLSLPLWRQPLGREGTRCRRPRHRELSVQRWCRDPRRSGVGTSVWTTNRATAAPPTHGSPPVSPAHSLTSSSAAASYEASGSVVERSSPSAQSTTRSTGLVAGAKLDARTIAIDERLDPLRCRTIDKDVGRCID